MSYENLAILGFLACLGACATPVGLEDTGSGASGGSSAGGTGAKSGSGGKADNGGKSGSGGGSGAGGSNTGGAGGSGGYAGTSGFGGGGTSGFGGSGGSSGFGGSSSCGGSGGFGGGAGLGAGGVGGGAGSGGVSAGGSGGVSAGGTGGVGGSGGALCTPPNPGGLCDPVTQCNCAPAQNCDFQGPSGFTSCGLAGTQAAYQSCTDMTQCSKGTSCVSYACKPFCATDNDCTAPGARCVQIYMGTPVPGWKACIAGCQLENPSARCGPGTTCIVALPDITDCVGGAGSGIGPGTCAGGNSMACAPGYTCQPDGACAKWCRIGMNDCPAGTTCSTNAVSVSVAGVAYGTCG